jgi:Tol biopolymer transport system component
MYPVDANQGKVTGEIRRITEDAAIDERVAITADGSRIAFISDRSGKQQVWTRDLTTGKDRMLSNEETGAYWPAISGDGTKVTYSSGRGGIKTVSTEGGVPELVIEERGSNWDLSADGTMGLVGGSRESLVLCYLGKHETSVALKLTSEQLLSPKFSPDAKWIVLHTRNSELTRRLYIAPLRPASPPPQAEWIPITDGKALDRDPGWSPDGKLIYWLTDRDGFRCIAARRVDGATKRPQGEMFYVAHFHSARRNMMAFTNTGAVAPAIAPGKMVFALGDRTGNIWLTKLP